MDEVHCAQLIARRKAADSRTHGKATSHDRLPPPLIACRPLARGGRGKNTRGFGGGNKRDIYPTHRASLGLDPRVTHSRPDACGSRIGPRVKPEGSTVDVGSKCPR